MSEHRIHIRRFAIINLTLAMICFLPAAGLAQEALSIEGVEAVREKLETREVVRVIARISPRVAPGDLPLEGAVLATA